MTAPPALRWLSRAWRDSGRKDLAYAAAVALLLMLFGPHGGSFFVTFQEGVDPLLDPGKNYPRTFAEYFLVIGVPLVFAVRVADLAIEDGVPRWLAYLVALLWVGAVHHAYRLLPLPANAAAPVYPAMISWYYLTIVLQGGIGLALYGRWRAAQRSMRLVQASETARAETARRLQSARLLALQARVDPQLLFDALRRVGVLQHRDPAAADALLNDLIAMLRAMLPGEASLTSTVEREFAVVDAWLRVTGSISGAVPPVGIEASAAARDARLAPMLALPLLRAALAVPQAMAFAWRFEATAAGGRLIVSLGAPQALRERVLAVIDGADLTPLHERLSLLHGNAAHLWVSRTPPAFTLDLPLSLDEPGDDDAANAVDRALSRFEAEPETTDADRPDR